jgi:two-component system chemotaxis response regulator CheY
VPTKTSDTSTPSSRPPHGRPARVLYAEDMADLREVMRLILQSEGYQIETVNDGAAALRCLRENLAGFDLLITDHHMPELNGLELVHQLRTTPYRGKIMVFSSELDPEVHREYHRLGVQVILPKPIRPSVLRKALEDLLPAAFRGPA